MVAPVQPGAPANLIRRRQVEVAIDPADRNNRIIIDLAAASRRPYSTVDYCCAFAIALLGEAARASGMLWYDVPNGGNCTVAADKTGDVSVVNG